MAAAIPATILSMVLATAYIVVRYV